MSKIYEPLIKNHGPNKLIVILTFNSQILFNGTEDPSNGINEVKRVLERKSNIHTVHFITYDTNSVDDIINTQKYINELLPPDKNYVIYTEKIYMPSVNERTCKYHEFNDKKPLTFTKYKNYHGKSRYISISKFGNVCAIQRTYTYRRFNMMVLLKDGIIRQYCRGLESAAGYIECISRQKYMKIIRGENNET